MIIRKILSVSVMLFISIFMESCSNNSDVSGTGSQAGNAKAFTVINDGNSTIVSGASVLIRQADQLSDTVQDTTHVSWTSDSSGRFLVDLLPPNTFWIIEARLDTTIAATLQVSVDASGKIISTSDTFRLKPFVSVTGMIDVSGIPHGSPVYVRFYGIGRAVPVDTSGKFTANRIPQGDFKFEIFASGIPGDTAHRPIEDSLHVGPMDTLNAGNFLFQGEIWKDTLLVRNLLNSNGDTAASVSSVIDTAADGHINYLHLSGIGFSTLLPELARLRLDSLRIDSTDIDVLSFDFSGMPGLKVLRLNGNKLTSLPPTIGALRQLRILDISNNVIDNLPQQITLLTHLDSLMIDNNKLAPVNTLDPALVLWIDTSSTDKNWQNTQL